MGICYFAVDMNEKTYFGPPGKFADKSPGVYHPDNPFPHMLVMKLVQGFKLDLYNDCGYAPCDDGGYKDITDKIYKEYLSVYPEAKQREYE